MEETSIELVDESKSPGEADVESSGGASEGAPVAPIDATLLVRANSESFINSPSHTVVDSAWRVFHHILDADGDGNVSIAELHDIVAAINPPGERVTPKARALLSVAHSRGELADADAEDVSMTIEEFVAARENTTQARSAVGEAVLGLVMWVLPTLYSLSTRLPFICVPLKCAASRFSRSPRAAWPGGRSRTTSPRPAGRTAEAISDCT